MLSACKNPRPTHRCGQCEYCRVLDRVDKVNRLKLEFGLRPHAFFITVTYDDIHLPVFSGQAELWRPDLESLINRVRNDLPKVTIFAVGEYGGKLFGNKDADRDIHPHYHLAVFSDVVSIHDVIRPVFEKKWRMGHVHILQLSSGLIDYITGYVSKKLTNKRSMEKVMSLNIQPEFTYSSRRPAIGDISNQLVQLTEEHGEITHLSLDGKHVVVPKYLRFKVKDLLLKWDLDLKNPEHRKIYEERKYAQKIENLQTLYEKNEIQKAEVDLRNMSGDVYKKLYQIRKQLIYNFESKMRLKPKGKPVL